MTSPLRNVNVKIFKIRKPSDLEEGELDMTLYDLADFIEHLVKDSG